MDKCQAIIMLGSLMMGCSAPRPFIVEEEMQLTHVPLSRIQSVAQLQVDAASVYGQMIEYYLENEKVIGSRTARPALQTVSYLVEAVLSFKPGSAELLPSYNDNRVQLERLSRELVDFTSDAGVELQTVRIKGYASPDGTTARNEELAAARAQRFSNYLSREQGIPQEKITVDASVEDWEGLEQYVLDASKPYADRVVAVLAQTVGADARRKALKALDKGRVWKDMEQTLFARLRRMELEIECRSVDDMPVTEDMPVIEDIVPENTTDLNRLVTLFNNRSDQLTLNELLAVAPVFRPGTEQFREVYELAAYRFPDCIPAQLNAGAAALAAEDREAARFFLSRVEGDPRAWINLGVLSLLENDTVDAIAWFRKALPYKPVMARRNLNMVWQFSKE